MSGRSSQRKGRAAERELSHTLQGYGYPVEAGRERRTAVLYVKSDTGGLIPITSNEVYTQCPECGVIHQVNISELIGNAVEDVCARCAECSREHSHEETDCADNYIDFQVNNEVAVEYLGDLVEHLKQTGAPLQVNTSRGIIDLGVENRICVTFAYAPGHDEGDAMALDAVDDD